MKDKGTVIAVTDSQACVRVDCLTGCHECSARIFCIGESRNEGLISADNPLKARPGDSVTLEIPVQQYTRSLSLLFGGLLAASLLGLLVGYALSRLFLWERTGPSLIGLAAGMAAGAFLLMFHFKQKNKKNLYPAISQILSQGGQNGQA